MGWGCEVVLSNTYARACDTGSLLRWGGDVVAEGVEAAVQVEATVYWSSLMHPPLCSGDAIAGHVEVR